MLQLFRIESERLKLPAPFGRRIAEPLDADAARQATFHCGFHGVPSIIIAGPDQIPADKGLALYAE